MATKWYGSLNNRIDENRMHCDEIEVGTLATEYLWSDRHAYEVIEVNSQKDVRIRKLKAIRTDHNGLSESQEYLYESDLAGKCERIVFFRGKWRRVHEYSASDSKGRDDMEYKYWRAVALSGFTEKQRADYEAGKTVIKYGEAISISFGIADEYYDFSF